MYIRITILRIIWPRTETRDTELIGQMLLEHSLNISRSVRIAGKIRVRVGEHSSCLYQ